MVYLHILLSFLAFFNLKIASNSFSKMLPSIKKEIKSQSDNIDKCQDQMDVPVSAGGWMLPAPNIEIFIDFLFSFLTEVDFSQPGKQDFVSQFYGIRFVLVGAGIVILPAFYLCRSNFARNIVKSTRPNFSMTLGFCEEKVHFY